MLQLCEHGTMVDRHGPWNPLALAMAAMVEMFWAFGPRSSNLRMRFEASSGAGHFFFT
jgi:hypothetical protein